MKRLLAALFLTTALVACQNDNGTTTETPNPSSLVPGSPAREVANDGVVPSAENTGSQNIVNALNARFAISPNDGGTATTEYRFNGSNSEGTIQSYSWNFGDGTTGKGAIAYHKFGKNGTFTVRLTVTATNGAKDTLDKQVVVGGSGGGGGDVPSGGVKCAPSRPPRDTRFFRVVSHDKAKKIIVARFEKPQTCQTVFMPCADVRIGGLTRTQKEYWIGTVCEVWNLGNNTFRLHLTDGRYWVNNGDKAYVWAQYDCKPSVACRAFGF